MNTFDTENRELDEEVWRAWVLKGKALDRERRRRWRMIAGSTVAGLVAIGGACVFLLSH